MNFTWRVIAWLSGGSVSEPPPLERVVLSASKIREIDVADRALFALSYTEENRMYGGDPSHKRLVALPPRNGGVVIAATRILHLTRYYLIEGLEVAQRLHRLYREGQLCDLRWYQAHRL